MDLLAVKAQLEAEILDASAVTDADMEAINEKVAEFKATLVKDLEDKKAKTLVKKQYQLELIEEMLAASVEEAVTEEPVIEEEVIEEPVVEETSGEPTFEEPAVEEPVVEEVKVVEVKPQRTFRTNPFVKNV